MIITRPIGFLSDVFCKFLQDFLRGGYAAFEFGCVFGDVAGVAARREAFVFASAVFADEKAVFVLVNCHKNFLFAEAALAPHRHRCLFLLHIACLSEVKLKGFCDPISILFVSSCVLDLEACGGGAIYKKKTAKVAVL